jgi:hypothetical protein
MKLCQVCNTTAADDVATCPRCGESSWAQGAKDECAADLAAIEDRRDEPTVPWQDVKAKLWPDESVAKEATVVAEDATPSAVRPFKRRR